MGQREYDEDLGEIVEAEACQGMEHRQLSGLRPPRGHGATTRIAMFSISTGPRRVQAALSYEGSSLPNKLTSPGTVMDRVLGIEGYLAKRTQLTS